MNRVRLGVTAVMMLSCALGGCLGDPPPDPEIAPLEVVIDGCVLNRPTVDAGTHGVAVVGDGAVEVVGPDGTVVLRIESSNPDVASPRPLEMVEGRYTFTCTSTGGDSATAELTVEPDTD